MHLGRANEARLQTATSSGAVYSMISVQIDDLITLSFADWILHLQHLYIACMAYPFQFVT